MKKSFVAMGEYYKDSTNLVRTVCRAIDVKTGEVMTVYVCVEENGFASDAYVMPELDFENRFLPRQEEMLAQLSRLECLLYTQEVTGSSPVASTIQDNRNGVVMYTSGFV